MDGIRLGNYKFMALNYYRLLGIPPDAGQRRIKSAYRSLAKRFHPDRNSGSETAAELFRQANQAYRVLSDPALRAHYDKKLAKLENLKLISEAYDRILEYYVDELDPKEVMEAAINGMLDDLDEHSNYLPPVNYEDLVMSTEGEFGGLGIEIEQESDAARLDPVVAMKV